MTYAIILDTETNDIENAEVIELAWGELGERFSSPFVKGAHYRFLPTRPIKWGALATHHIFGTDLLGKPPSSTALKMVPEAKYWIGHNIDFDWKALGSPPGVKRICTLALSRSLFPEVDSHTLTAMTYFFQGANAATREKVRAAHSAEQDIELTRELFTSLCDVLDKTSLEAIYLASEEARIPRIWPFGKFKGQPIAAADKGYAAWCRKQPDFDSHVLEALRRAGL